MEYRESMEGEVLVVVMTGKLDVYTGKPAIEHFTEYLNQGRRKFLVDLREVQYMDSTGLGAFLQISKNIAKADGLLKAFGPTDSVLHLFRISGMVDMFGCFGTREEGLASLAQH